MTAVRLTTCNAKKELNRADARSVIIGAAKRSDIIVWQEIETLRHHAAVLSLRKDFLTYWPAGRAKPLGAANAVPISIRKGKFQTLYTGKELVSEGVRGKYPNEYVTWLGLGADDGAEFAVMNMHLLPQSQTSHKERRDEWLDGADVVNERTATILGNWGNLIGGGDMNSRQWAPKGTTGLWASVPSAGTQWYDSLFYGGDVEPVGAVQRTKNKSDHCTLTATFEIAA